MKPATFHAIKMAINPPLPQDEINEHLLLITTICLFQLADKNGHAFVQGFLNGASDSLETGEKFGEAGHAT